MDLKGKDAIVPVMAIKPLHLSGGPAMVQAVPEEYVLASNIMMLQEQKKGEDLEFVMKAYLPVNLITTGIANRCVFNELLGLTSAKMKLASQDILEKETKTLESSNDKVAITKSVEKATSFLEGIAASPLTEYPGILRGPYAESLGRIIHWPNSSEIEPHSLVLDPMIDEKQTKQTSRKFKDSFECLSHIQDRIRSYDDMLDKRIGFISEKATSSVSGRIRRLGDRISTLKEEIEYLESRKAQYKSERKKTSDDKKRLSEIDKDLKDRKSALERDLQRKEKYEDQTTGTTKALRETQQKIRTLIRNIWPVIDEIRKKHSGFAQSCPTSETDSQRVLLLPILLVGLSRKGQLRVMIIPPLLLNDTSEKVSMRRDFVYPFSHATSPVNVIVRSLSERANNDIAFRKTLRSESQEKNILALDSTRKMLLDGAQLLLADGLVKESGVTDLKELLSKMPVIKSKKLSRHERKAPTIPAGSDVCDVVFNIHTDGGLPIEGAELELGALLLESDRSGRIDVALPLSNYDGVIRARGYHSKQFDFTLSSPGSIAVPIVLSELSREDQLSEELDMLVDKAKRLDIVRAKLNEAFEAHGDTILQIPAYRNILVELLSDLGLEPESWIAQAEKKRGMMKRLLKRDERRERIQRDILRLAEESKQMGGVMLLSELLVRLDDMGWETGSENVESLLKEMTKEGLLEGVTNLENGARLVKFIPVALTDDPQRILALASKHDGRLTIEEAVVELGWTEDRVKTALDLLLVNGVAKLQKSFSRSTQYWFPGLKGRKN
ncbi:MAG: hypothetical protein ACW98Y_13620 [Candidatus Thorarchaeota archaeon]|jgi:hypothetical protein